MSTLHQNTVTDPGTPAGTNAGTDAGTGSQRLRGPYWVAARTHRSTLQGAAGLLVLAVLLLIAIRVWGGGLAGGYWTDTRIVENAASVIALLPYLIAAFVAGPVVARELESGTHQLLWTQSVSPSAGSRRSSPCRPRWPSSVRSYSTASTAGCGAPAGTRTWP